MSHSQFHTGRLKKIVCEVSPEETAKQLLGSIKPDFYDTYLEYLISENSERYIMVGDEIYELLDHIKNSDGEQYFCQIYHDEKGDLRFITNFYNGGTCLPEMIEAGLNQFNDKNYG